MLEFDNSINFSYYQDMVKNNKSLCDKRNVHIDKFYLNNRELIAIIDLLIACDSEKFVGCYISSFSQVIKHHFNYKNKECILYK